MKELAGVENVEVSLNQGTVTLELKPGNKVAVEQVREIVRKNGFTPKEALVTVAGRLIERKGKPALQVAGIDQVLLLAGQDGRAAALAGKEVVVTGKLAEAGPSSGGPLEIEVATIAPAEKSR
jgi:hypothetical protein